VSDKATKSLALCENSVKILTIAELAELIRDYLEDNGLLGVPISTLPLTKFREYCKTKKNSQVNPIDIRRALEFLVCDGSGSKVFFRVDSETSEECVGAYFIIYRKID
jgi:hypothetical protein